MSSGSNKRKRTKLVALRLTPEEYEALHKRCDDYGLSVGELVRTQCLDQPLSPRRRRTPKIETELVARVLAQLGKIGSNLNQIAHQMNAGNSVAHETLARALTDVSMMRDACMSALNRKP